MAAISSTVFRAAIKRALAEGEARGRRLERRALMLAMPVLISKSGTAKFSLPLRNWIAARSKRWKVGK